MELAKKRFGTALMMGLVLAVASITPLHAQKAGASKSTVAEQIALIRKRYDAIDSATKKYTIRKRKITNTDPIGDGRDQDYTGYYDKGELRKIVVTAYGDHGSDTWKYYFWQGKLFFLYHTAIGYYEHPNTKKVTWEERLYFADNRVIRWLGDKNAPQRIDTPAARESADDKRAAARDAALLLSKPAPRR